MANTTKASTRSAVTITPLRQPIHSLKEAEKYPNIAGFARVAAETDFLKGDARNNIVVVSSDDITFTDKNGNKKEAKEMVGGWYRFDGSTFRQSTDTELRAVSWWNKVYFTEKALGAIKNGQRLLAVGIDYFVRYLEVNPDIREGDEARVALLSQVPQE
ncbi:MAG: hypothetical protein ABSE71_02855 [Candidatus Micrarchaeaceae archaeon]|jgi:hypothetical protein|nr:hypothetical protein [Candidatus Micrarchaeota archaeon]